MATSRYDRPNIYITTSRYSYSKLRGKYYIFEVVHGKKNETTTFFPTIEQVNQITGLIHPLA